MVVSGAMAGLAERVEELGPVAHLVTVGAGGLPHVVSVRVAWRDEELVAGVGRTTAANIRQRPGVTLLWAAAPGTGYSLIVDGKARVTSEGDEPAIAVEPTGAVLHKRADGDPDAPTCIAVLR